jgi:hypothetical protein
MTGSQGSGLLVKNAKMQFWNFFTDLGAFSYQGDFGCLLSDSDSPFAQGWKTQFFRKTNRTESTKTQKLMPANFRVLSGLRNTKKI